MLWIARFLSWIGVVPKADASKWKQQREVTFIFKELLEQIVEEVLSLNPAVAQDKEFSSIREKLANGEVDASTVYRAEMILLDMLEVDGLRLRVRALRDLLSGLLTADAYANFERGFIPDLNDKNVTEKALKAEAWAIASRSYRRYAMVPSVEYQRSIIIVKMASWLTMLSIVLVILVCYWRVPLFYPIGLIAGASGAAMSVTMRLYQIDPRHEPLLTWLSVAQGKWSIYLSPILGAAFGLVFLMIVRANLVSGDLFPNFRAEVWLGMDLAGHGCSRLRIDDVNLRAHASECGETYLQYAKVAVWAFIAGWAERMVPDVLNKLSQQPQPTIPKS